jgi:hypothetical protein
MNNPAAPLERRQATARPLLKKQLLVERFQIQLNRKALYFFLRSGRIFLRKTGVHFSGKCSRGRRAFRVVRL